MMTQTAAIFVDAYRELHARKMFWTVIFLNIFAILLFGVFGANDHAMTVLWYEPFGNFLTPSSYKVLFSNAVVGFWFTWVATILALISTAGIFPDLMSSGSIDLYLAKPISRLRLFLTKYAAGLLFVALQVTIFTTLSFLVLGIRGGFWEPGLFWAIPLVLIFFSYLFGICVLLGVWTRSTIAALLLTLLVWGGIFVVDFVDKNVGRFSAVIALEHDSLDRRIAALDSQIARAPAPTQPTPLNENSTTQSGMEDPLVSLKARRDQLVSQRDRALAPDTLKRVQTALYVIKSFMPKTRETLNLLDRVLFNDKELQESVVLNDDADVGTPDAAQPRTRPMGPQFSGTLLQAQIDRQRPIWWIIGTSLLFETVVLALAAWHFCTRDF